MENHIDTLAGALHAFAGLNEKDMALSLPYWRCKTYSKGDYFNKLNSVCTNLGFIVDGIFRSYIIDDQSEEKNIFLYSKNQFVVTFKSFVAQTPCDYHTTALTEARVVYICHDDLNKLFKESHAWERFGRLLAEKAFQIAIDRIEGFVFKSNEERYRDLTRDHPDILDTVPLYHISTYLGITSPSLSRIRKRITKG